MARKSLAKWIDEALGDKEKEHTISAFALVHMVGQQRQELYTMKISPTGSYDGGSLEKVFKGKAESYAQDLGTVQTFALLAFYGKNTEEAVQPFTVTPESNPATMGLTTEPPTVEGRVQQRMRQDDALFIQVYRRQQTMDDHSIRMLDAQDRMLARSQAMVEKLQAENMDAFVLVKELLAAQANDSHKLRMEQLAFQRSTNEREKLIKFAPVLINSILGKEVFPQSTEDTVLIETIAENLEEKHIAKLAELDLPPMLMGPLMGRVMKAMEQKEQREAESKKQLPAFKGSAEDDVSGGGA
jgi:hypothetical protein